MPNYTKCLKHAVKDCELYCDECDIPVCTTCIASGKHEGHRFSDVLEKLCSKKEFLQKDLTQLENQIYPQYQAMAADVHAEKSKLDAEYEELAREADQQGELWHGEISAIVNKQKSQIEERKTKHRGIIEEKSEDISHKMNEIEKAIQEMKTVLDSNDIFLVSDYKARNEDFNKLPYKLKVTMPSLSVPKIDTEKLNEMFGSVSELSVTTVKPLLNEPRLAATIDTGYKYGLYGVTCASEDQVWTYGDNNTMKLLNLQGDLLTSIQTTSVYGPGDIAMTRDGDLVYTDPNNKRINLVKNEQTRTVITLQGWYPHSVCCTASADLLVTMLSDDGEQSKVLRYSGSTEKQTTQHDGKGRHLYSSARYICENRNLDICVSDAVAVVVVNMSGKLRFMYTGQHSNIGGLFDPRGLTTNSQGHILVADFNNHRVHIVDQDGQFLRYIRDLDCPFGLCVDTRDNLFVVERNTAKVKKIQYL
jgi:hypothetical protein